MILSEASRTYDKSSVTFDLDDVYLIPGYRLPGNIRRCGIVKLCRPRNEKHGDVRIATTAVALPNNIEIEDDQSHWSISARSDVAG